MGVRGGSLRSGGLRGGVDNELRGGGLWDGGVWRAPQWWSPAWTGLRLVHPVAAFPRGLWGVVSDFASGDEASSDAGDELQRPGDEASATPEPAPEDRATAADDQKAGKRTGQRPPHPALILLPSLLNFDFLLTLEYTLGNKQRQNDPKLSHEGARGRGASCAGGGISRASMVC